MTTRKHPDTRLARRLPERRYLSELHGVRGLALLGVVIFHLFGAGRTSGGIDIFLAVTGFLFTGMLLREATASGGRVDLFKYFGRLFRRIFIPAALVAVVTLAVGLLISSATQHRQLWAEARATLLYFENFELINSQLAYGAAGPDTSPFQHFWSLSVQGQFYLVWPVVAVIAVILAKAAKTSAARIMAILAGIIFVVSFAYAIYVGSFNQQEAYLMTTSRAWQLAFGALLALAGSTIKLPKFLRGPAGWIGVGLIVTCGLFLDGAQLFPGPWALWPLLGLTLVLISAGADGGNNDPKGTATHFLSNKPLAWIGDHAYGLYLWHWPLLIFYLEVRGRDAIGIRGALVILAATVALAMLMYRYIEQPLQRVTKQRRPGGIWADRPTVFAGISTLAVAGIVTSTLSPSPQALQATYGDLDSDLYPGAAVHFMSEDPPFADVFPAPEDAREYRQEYAKRACEQKMGENPGTDEIKVCEDLDAPDNPTATVVLAGGSHAGHFEEAFKTLGKKYDWEVLVVLKPACVFGGEEYENQTKCGAWNNNFIDWLDDNEIDLVVTPGTRHISEPDDERIEEAAPKWWDRISSAGPDLLLTRGTPRKGGTPIPECLAEGGTAQECGASKREFVKQNPLVEMELPSNVYTIDITEYVCPAINDDALENCDAVVGNILGWFDGSHFTTPFSQSLAPGIEAEMKETIPHLVR